MTDALIAAARSTAARAAAADARVDGFSVAGPTTSTLSRPAGLAPAKGRRLGRRHLWLIPGLAIAIYANVLGKDHGVGILALVAFGIGPDLPRLLRFRGQPFGRRLAGVAIPMSNVLHHPLVAFAALALTGAGAVNELIPIVAVVASLVWFSHVVIGWAIGDGIRPVEVAR